MNDRPHAATAIPDERALANGFGAALLSESVPELVSGAWELVECRLVSIREQRRKRIVTYGVRWRDLATGAEEAADVVVKLYGFDRGAPALSTLQSLWQAGFRPPTEFRVPRPFGYSPGHGALLQGHAPGTPWADYLGERPDRMHAASARAAAWLVALEGAPVAPAALDPAATSREVRRFAAELGAAFDDHAGRLERLAGQIAERLEGGPGATLPAHGDYHPKNVFLEDGAATVIDFDTFGGREPGYDAGYALGQLLVMSRFRHGSFAPGVAAASAFARRYAEGGAATWDRIAVHASRTLVQSLHFELCTLRNRRIELLPLWPTMAEKFLDSRGPEALEDLVRLG